MHALTVLQPWAHAILHLGKEVENRCWLPPARLLGQWIAVHAGRRVDTVALAEVRASVGAGRIPELPTGALLGTVRLTGAHPARSRTCRCGEWAEDQAGVMHWLLADPRPARTPRPCPGRQKLWIVPADLAARLTGGAR